MPEDLPYGQRGTGRLPHSALAACVKPPAFHKFASLTSRAKVGASIRHWRDAGLSNSLRSNNKSVSGGSQLLRCAPQPPAHRPCPSAPVGQDCGHPPLALRRPQTCCPTSALPRMLSHPAAPPARRRRPSEPAAPADCPLPPATD